MLRRRAPFGRRRVTLTADPPADDNFIVRADWTSKESTAFAYRNDAGTSLLVTAIKFGDGVLHLNGFLASDAVAGGPELAATLNSADCLDPSTGAGSAAAARRLRWSAVESRLQAGILAKLPAGKTDSASAGKAGAGSTNNASTSPVAPASSDRLRESYIQPGRVGPDRGAGWGDDFDPLRDPRFPQRPMVPGFGGVR